MLLIFIYIHNNILLMRSVSKIDARGRIALSPKMRKTLNVEIGNYIAIEEINGELVISRFTG